MIEHNAKTSSALGEQIRSATPELGALADRPVSFMFPGLGEQYVNMGLGLYRAEPEFRNQVDQCCELLKPELGLDLRTVLYPDRDRPESAHTLAAGAPAPRPGLDLRRMIGRAPQEPDRAAQRLNETYLTQPALFVTEYALARLWLSWGLSLDSMIGYSLGEYVAACLAGVLSLDESLLLVAYRAQLIQELPAGAMLAVTLSEPQVQPLLGEHLSLSAVNGPEFCVVSGPPEAIEELERRLAHSGTVTRRVKSSHAFHSKMMEPIAQRVTRLAAVLKRHPPQIPYWSNVTGNVITAAQACDPTYWATHLCSPVRFAEGLAELGREPARILMEIGPGQSLSSLAALLPRAAPVERLIVPTMRHAYDPQDDTAVLVTALDRLRIASAPSQVAPEPEFAAPRTEIEATLAALWSQQLSLERVGRDDHYFEQGGNSLLATKLIFQMRKAFRVDTSLRRIYEAPTLAGLAAVVEELIAAKPGSAPRATASAAAIPAPAIASRPLRRFALPDGTEILHQNEAETRHFYHDIFEQRSYVKHGIRIPDRACVFDVGANIGLFTLFASREARDVTVYSFEPALPTFEIMKQNAARYCPGAKPFNLGISDRAGTAQLTFYPNSSGMSSLQADAQEEKDVLRALMRNERAQGSGEAAAVMAYEDELLDVRFASETLPCELRRLSQIIQDSGVDHIDLLKVDVQKAELQVLRGIDDGDWDRIDQIVVEVHAIEDRLSELCGLLRNRGYHVITEQDPLYAGTNIHNVYALRPNLTQQPKKGT